MDWSDLKEIVGDAAPILGTLLGGPAGTAVGAIIAHALGTDATPDAVHAAIAADPAAALKLAEIESNNKVELQKLTVSAEQNRLTADTAELQARLADAASARQMQMNTHSTTPTYLAYGVTAGFFGLLTLLATHDVPTGSSNVLYAMAGALGSSWATIVGFYFGSSKSAGELRQSLVGLVTTTNNAATAGAK